MSEINPSVSRRRMLGMGAGAAGALVLGTALTAEAQDIRPPKAPPVTKAEAATTTELVLKLTDHSELDKVGGYVVVDSPDGHLITARTEENTYVTCSARCPHRGFDLTYVPESKEFVCPLHNSRFDVQGKLVRGPAKTDIRKYGCDGAAVIELA